MVKNVENLVKIFRLFLKLCSISIKQFLESSNKLVYRINFKHIGFQQITENPNKLYRPTFKWSHKVSGFLFFSKFTESSQRIKNDLIKHKWRQMSSERPRGRLTEWGLYLSLHTKMFNRRSQNVVTIGWSHDDQIQIHDSQSSKTFFIE